MMDGYDFTEKKGIIGENDYPYLYSPYEHACQDTSKKWRFKNTGAQEEDEISN